MSAKHDKWKAAIHESGHAVVTRSLGGIGEPLIFKNPVQKKGQNVWIGICKMHSDIDEMPGNWEVIAGMAGFIAERIEDGVTNADLCKACLEVAISEGKISKSDRVFIGEQWTLGEIEYTINLLVENWRHVIFEAEWLVQSCD